MKIVSLNTWGGILWHPLVEFLKQEEKNTDIFCFQELLFSEKASIGEAGERHNLCAEIQALLPNFYLYPMYAPIGTQFQGRSLGIRLGQGIFVRKNIEVTGFGELKTYPTDSEVAQRLAITLTGNFNYVKVRSHGREILVGNLHGLWQQEGKVDTAPRLEQSRILHQFLDSIDIPIVLCGDFNIRPDTQSMALLESRLSNLIKDYGITSTRTEFYKKPEKFSDYVLISPELEVDTFDVPAVSVSDHRPLSVSLRLNQDFSQKT